MIITEEEFKKMSKEERIKFYSTRSIIGSIHIKFLDYHVIDFLNSKYDLIKDEQYELKIYSRVKLDNKLQEY